MNSCNPSLSSATKQGAELLIESCVPQGTIVKSYKCERCGLWHARVATAKERWGFLNAKRASRRTHAVRSEA